MIFCFISRCGFATIHSVEDMSHEDRMESFFLSETLKYLYLVRVFLFIYHPTTTFYEQMHKH